MRVAWFTPLPPSRSGIAAYSAEVLPHLRSSDGLDIDVYYDDTPAGWMRSPAEVPAAEYLATGVAARDFVWRQRRRPYDLTVYQLGNARCHDYMWGYLFRYPGLVVLHDAQLHQSRALHLLQRWRPRLDDYRAEFVANHPGTPAAITRLVEAGQGGTLFQQWPHIALVLRAARLVAVHSPRLAHDLAEAHGVEVAAVAMGVGDPLGPAGLAAQAAGGSRLAAGDVRARYGIPDGAVVIAAFGGITREKRIPELLASVAALAEAHPRLHVLLVGAAHGHYDVQQEVAGRCLGGRVHLTGFVADGELPAYLAAADIVSSLRWPTNRETSASWLRAVAAGKPTIVTDLAHMDDVPVLNAQTWARADASSDAPVAVAIDILDEQASLTAAIGRLAGDGALRARLGADARRYFEARHTVAHMAEAYRGLLSRAATRPVPTPALPPHLTETGTEHGRVLLAGLGVHEPLLD